MTAIHSVALHVRDLDRVAAFYRDVIGLEAVASDGEGVWLGAGGRKLLHLVPRPDFHPVDPGAAGLFHTAFLLPSRADLGRFLRHLDRLGLSLDGTADHLVSEAVYLHDPEGNGIEVYADRPRATWRWDQDGIVMANDRLDIPGLKALDDQVWTGAPPGTVIGHVHLQVGDIDRAVPFYTETLGFTPTRRWPQALFMGTGGYHHYLAVNTWRSAGAGHREPDRAGLAGVTLLTSTAIPDLVTDPWGTHFTSLPEAKA